MSKRKVYNNINDDLRTLNTSCGYVKFFEREEEGFANDDKITGKFEKVFMDLDFSNDCGYYMDCLSMMPENVDLDCVEAFANIETNYRFPFKIENFFPNEDNVGFEERGEKEVVDSFIRKNKKKFFKN